MSSPSAKVRFVSDPTQLSAAELATAYQSGELTPVDVWHAVRERIDRFEPVLHALASSGEGSAEHAATASSDRWQRGQPLSRLDGVPVTVKENIATAGVPTRLGSAATDPDAVASHDAPVAARLREAGAVVVGKTTMPDYGMLSSGVSSLNETARNPWNPAWTPGGSSAGAAAAAAARYGPSHVGPDIGGSIRLPAGWTGVVGFKPSFGRVPVDPAYYGRAAGPLTRSVADAAAAMAVISRPDGRDQMSLPPADLAWDELAIDPAGRRIAVDVDAGAGMSVERPQSDAVSAAVVAFESAGVRLSAVGPLITEAMLAGVDRFWRMRGLLDWRELPAAQQDLVLPYLREWMEPAESFTGAEVFDGFSQMDAMSRAVRDTMADFDFLLTPVAPVAAFAADQPSPRSDPDRAMEHIGFTVPFNMSGHPAISVPWTMSSDGRPIGIQLVGRRFMDLDVLRLAAVAEALRPALPPWPEPATDSSPGR
jgi:aspartyl-tRNA(Asn)/glutamyl-tRNA(Gln) amidotransferase subunit A